MRLLLVGLLGILLAGCDQPGRYQIAAMSGGGAGVWRVDTATGAVTLCGVNLGAAKDGKIACVNTFN